jgi:hypothetical protein
VSWGRSGGDWERSIGGCLVTEWIWPGLLCVAASARAVGRWGNSPTRNEWNVRIALQSSGAPQEEF